MASSRGTEWSWVVGREVARWREWTGTWVVPSGVLWRAGMAAVESAIATHDGRRSTVERWVRRKVRWAVGRAVTRRLEAAGLSVGGCEARVSVSARRLTRRNGAELQVRVLDELAEDFEARATEEHYVAWLSAHEADLVRARLEGWSVEAIGAHYGVTRGMAYQWLERLRERLEHRRETGRVPRSVRPVLESLRRRHAVVGPMVPMAEAR